MPLTPDERPGIPGGPGGPGGPGTLTASKQNNQFLVIWFRNVQIFRFNTLNYKYYALFYICYFQPFVSNYIYRIVEYGHDSHVD